MASPRRNGSTLRRLRSGLGIRLTESLLSSSGRVAGVGLATAALTLGFTIWFRFDLVHQSEVEGPLSRSASELEASIARSLAALRAWVAYRDPGAVRTRSRIWSQEIEPSIADLKRLAKRTQDPEVDARVARLDEDLRNLKRLQWAIEDVAHTPGNTPASLSYEQRMEPQRDRILRGLADAIEQIGERSAREGPARTLRQLASFRAAFAEADLALNELLVRHSAVLEHEVDESLAHARQLAKALEARADTPEPGDAERLLAFVLDAFHAYAMQVPAVVAARRSPNWNVAGSLFREKARPITERASATSRELVAEQTALIERQADQLGRASYVVVAAAALMGLLSAGSLFVSARLKRQVEHVVKSAQTLGQYAIERRIGSGGMGQVFLARHAMLHRPAAVKLLRSESVTDVRAQERLRTEVQMSCALTHPNTVEIFDYGRTPEGLLYYAMEYLEGFDLQALVATTGPVESSRVVHILVQACGSIDEAHRKGLLHRDIKPGNIMLTERGGVYDTVKVLDFGLVRGLADVSDESESDVIAGTPMYVAPEVILSAEAASPQADLYALGAVGYYLLTGSPVFESDNLLELFRQHLEDEPRRPSDRVDHPIPADLEAVILGCLAKDPSERPESARDLSMALRACACGVWTAEDAENWWSEYGEAARHYRVSEEPASGLRSGFAIVLDSKGA